MLIEMEMSCKYSIKRSYGFDEDILSAAVDLFCILSRGDSYSSEDSRNELRRKIQTVRVRDCYEDNYMREKDEVRSLEEKKKKCQVEENKILRRCGIPRSGLWISECEYGHYQFGTRIFCMECLREGRVTRRIHGCNSRDCYANNTFWKMHTDDDVSKITNAECHHTRCYSDRYVYCMTPVSHLVLLTNTGLDDRITHSTRNELGGVISHCKENKVTCPSCSFNTAYCYSYLGEVRITESLCELYGDIVNPKSIRNSLKAIGEKLVGDSVERRYYILSIFVVVVMIAR